MQSKRSPLNSPTRDGEEPASKRQTLESAQSIDEPARQGKGDWKKGAREKEPQRVAKPLAEGEEKQARLPKKKTAVLIGYCGTGYSGMQLQPSGARTIEGDLFDALVKAGAISKDNSNDAKKVDLQRAARTDAGVHAAGNCISLKMITTQTIPEEFTNLPEYINSFLPPTIRVWGYIRTLAGFQARQGCDSRVYEYLLPSYALLPPRPGCALAKKLDESSPGWRAASEAADTFWAGRTPALADEAPIEDLEKLKSLNQDEAKRWRGWRVDKASLARFREIIAAYKGTHNFHNFTVGKPHNDKTVKRYMLSLEMNDPQVYGDIEWISIRLHGQSFMLHQIRKMISMAVLMTRTNTPLSLLEAAFASKDITIPKAPPLGLLLEQPQFGVYNDRIKQNPGGADLDRDQIDYEPYRADIEAFKVKHIYERLREEELATLCYYEWTKQMDNAAGPELDYLNSTGTILDSAIQRRKPAQARKDRGDAGETGGAGGEGIDSDDDVDQVALKRGELEG